MADTCSGATSEPRGSGQGGCRGPVGSQDDNNDRGDGERDKEQRQTCTADSERFSPADSGGNSMITKSNSSP